MKRDRLVLVVAAALLVTACSGTPSTSQREQKPSSPSSQTSIDGELEEMVPVAGHRLWIHCSGTGHPTAVLLHGWIDEPGLSSQDIFTPVTTELSRDLRVCYYDRTNVGQSEKAPGTQSPAMVVRDLDEVMRGVGERGPFVLVGQSAGGMVASAYAVAHPDKVAGIVMVDASFDEEITIEDVGMVPNGPCDPVNRRIDGHQSLQRIDNCAMYRWAYARRDRRPGVPLVYLAAKRSPWSQQTEMGARYARRIVPLQRRYAQSWSPGRFVWVDSGHDIELEQPAVVADAVRWVVRH